MAYSNPNDPRRAVSSKKHYLKNKIVYIASAKQTKEKMRAYVRRKKDRPCTDCGKRYPYYVMQFDHVRDKQYNIATLVNYNNRVKIDTELAKCEVVCANCHMERTHQRGI